MKPILIAACAWILWTDAELYNSKTQKMEDHQWEAVETAESLRFCQERDSSRRQRPLLRPRFL
jgi:hypothetical protein